MKVNTTVVCGVLLLVSVSTTAGQTSLDWQRIAEKITAQMQLQPGEKVLLVGSPGAFDPLVSQMEAAVKRSGGNYLGALSVSAQQFAGGMDRTFVSSAYLASRDALKQVFRDVDIAVMMPGAAAFHPEYAAMQEVLRSGKSRTIHFHWTGAYQLDGRVLPMSPEIDRFYQRVLLETDYQALARLQEAFEREARQGEIRVTTAAGTDIRFRIGDRPVTRQDGNASASRASRARNLIDREIELPAGAIRVAPIEESVNGVIVIPLSDWNGASVRDVWLRFVDGKVVERRAQTGLPAVEAEMARAGDAGRSFREFALGLNPLLAIPKDGPWIPYYGYGAGVVRLSLGDNTELGGKVTGGYVRWNFFPDASVWVNGVQWIKDGTLLRR